MSAVLRILVLFFVLSGTLSVKEPLSEAPLKEGQQGQDLFEKGHVHPGTEFQNEKDPHIFAAKTIDQVRRDYNEKLSEGNATKLSALNIDQNTQYGEEANNLAKRIFESGLEAGSGIGQIRQTGTHGTADYRFTFCRTRNDAAGHAVNETVRRKRAVISALTSIYQSATGNVFANFDAKPLSIPIMDPVFSANNQHEDSFVLTRRLSYADLKLIISDKNKGVGVGISSDEMSTVVVFLYYGDKLVSNGLPCDLTEVKSSTPKIGNIRAIARDMVAAELAEYIATNPELSKLSSHASTQNFAFCLGKRYVLVFRWTESIANTKLVQNLKTFASDLKPVNPNQVTKQEVIKEDKETVLVEVLEGFTREEFVKNSQYGFGYGLSRKFGNRQLSVYVSFGDLLFQDVKISEAINKKRTVFGYKPFESNLIEAFTLNELAKKIINMENKKNPSYFDEIKTNVFTIGAGTTYTFSIEIIPKNEEQLEGTPSASNSNAQPKGTLVAKNKAALKKPKILEPSPYVIFNLGFSFEKIGSEEENVLFKPFKMKDIQNSVIQDAHIYSPILKSVGMASIDRENHVVNVVVYGADVAELKRNEGISRRLAARSTISEIVRGGSYALASELVARQLQLTYIHKYEEKNNKWNTVAKGLAADLLHQHMCFSGYGMGHIYKEDLYYHAFFVNVNFEQIPPAAKRKGQSYEDALKQGALEVAVKVLCRDGRFPDSWKREQGSTQLPEKLVLNSAGSKFYNPNFDFNSKSFIIMRQGIHDFDLDFISQIQEVYGVAVMQSEHSGAEKQQKRFMVVFASKFASNILKDSKFKKNLTLVSQLSGSSIKAKESLLQNYCNFRLAEDFLSNYVSQTDDNADALGPEGFGVGHKFGVAFAKIKFSDNNAGLLQAENALVTNFLEKITTTNVNNELAKLNFDLSKFNLHFQWKTKYPVQTFLPISQKVSPWGSYLVSTSAQEDMGISVKLSDEKTFGWVALTFTSTRLLDAGIRLQINQLRKNNFGIGSYSPFNSSTIHSAWLNLAAKHVTHMLIESEAVKMQSEWSAVGQGNECTSIFIKRSNMDANITAKKALNSMFEDMVHFDSVTDILKIQESNDMELKIDSLILPVWNESTNWDVLQLLIDTTQGTGYYHGKCGDAWFLTIVFYAPSSLAQTKVSEAFQGIISSRKNSNLAKLTTPFFSPTLSAVGQKIARHVFAASVSEGHVYGGKFKATFYTFPTPNVNDGLADITKKFFTPEATRKLDILKAELNLTWSEEVYSVPRELTLISRERCTDDLNHVYDLKVSQIGLGVEVFEEKVVIVLVTPIEKLNKSINDSIYKNINLIRGPTKLPFSRTTSLAATFDILSQKIGIRLLAQPSTQPQGVGVGKNPIAFYKKVPNADDPEALLKNFVNGIVDKYSQKKLPNILDYAEEGNNQFNWEDDDDLSHMIPNWKDCTDWDYILITSRKAIEAGMSYSRIEGEKSNLEIILVALFYFETPDYYQVIDNAITLIANNHLDPVLKQKGITIHNYVSAIDNCVADELAEKLLLETDQQDGFGVGKRFTGAFRREEILSNLTWRTAISRLKAFVGSLTTRPDGSSLDLTSYAKNVCEHPPLENDLDTEFAWVKSKLENGSEVRQAFISDTFTPIADHRTSRDFCQLISKTSKSMGVGLAIDFEKRSIMMVLLCPWKHEPGIFGSSVIQKINQLRLLPLTSNSSLASALNFIAFEVASNNQEKSGYFKGNNASWTVICKESSNQNESANTKLSGSGSANLGKNVSNQDKPSSNANLALDSSSYKSFVDWAQALVNKPAPPCFTVNGNAGTIGVLQNSGSLENQPATDTLQNSCMGVYTTEEMIVLVFPFNENQKNSNLKNLISMFSKAKAFKKLVPIV